MKSKLVLLFINPFVILFPLQPDVCDVYLLNHAILVVMLIYRGLSGHSADYRVYMSENMGVSTCQRGQPYLILYKLGGSVTRCELGPALADEELQARPPRLDLLSPAREASAPPRAPGQETSCRPRARVEGHFGTSERNITGSTQSTDGWIH